MYISFNYHKYGDFKPYLIVTKDGGRTWKSISSNIPENNFVWTVVEDHINPKVLFIGTEFECIFQWTQELHGGSLIKFLLSL